MDTPTALLVLSAILVAYLVYVAKVRFRAINSLQQRFGATPEEFKNLHYKEAQYILGHLYAYEVPWIFNIGQDYAVIRTFALPAVSKMGGDMLTNTGLRYSTTYALAREWMVNPLDSERSNMTINRVNYIHSRYKGIENDAMLYTLCCLMCIIPNWVDEYEYRQTVPLERHASYLFWKEVGIRLGIKESSIPGSFEGCAQFIKDYDLQEMRPDDNSAKMAQAVIRMYQATVPWFLRPLFANVFIYFHDPIIRDAFKLTLDTSPIIGTLTRLFPLALKLRGKFIRYCLLPATGDPKAFTPAEDGRMNVTIWTMMPYYVQATWWNRWGPNALYRRAFGLAIPGKQWLGDGYKLEEIGHGGRGGKKVLEVTERAKQGGCPVSTFGRIENEAEIGGVYAQFHSSPPFSQDKSS